MSSVPFYPPRAILPLICAGCSRVVRLQISDPTGAAIRQIWACDGCGAENTILARWQVVKVMPGDISPA